MRRVPGPGARALLSVERKLEWLCQLHLSVTLVSFLALNSNSTGSDTCLVKMMFSNQSSWALKELPPRQGAEKVLKENGGPAVDKQKQGVERSKIPRAHSNF